MYHILAFTLLALAAGLTQTVQCYMQQPTMLGRLRSEFSQEEKEDFLKNQSTKLADLDRDADEFNRWVEREGLLTYYKRVLDMYNDNQKIEKEYTEYMLAASKAPASKTAALTPPAGYRLPQHRHTFAPLSEVLDKLDKINDTLSSDFFHGPNIPGITSKKIDELRDRVKEYESKYLRPSDRDVREFAAPPDMVAKVENIKNTLESTENALENVRTGLMNYLVEMGISDAENSGLREHPNDMKDMAEAVEEHLQQLANLPVAQELKKTMYARYSSTPNLNQNPFLMPLTPTTTFLGATLDTLPQTVAEHTAALMAENQFIRDKAVPKRDVIDAATPTEPTIYFIETFIPPDITSMMQNSNVHEYMFKGYLGYWLQQIINQVFELRLSGATILTARLTFKKLAEAARTQMLAPLLINFPDLAAIPIVADCTNQTVSLSAIKQALTSGFADLATTGAALTAQLTAFQKDPAVIKQIKAATDQVPEVLQTEEGITLRKTLLVLSLLAACAQNNTNWGPSTYTNDLCGPIPTVLFPTPVETAV
jgi:hypothetical protein